MITFNGIDLAKRFGTDEAGFDRFNVIQITGRGPMSQETTRVVVPGRAGSYYQGRRRKERTIGVRFLLRGTSFEDLRQKVDDLNTILNVDKPVPIEFDDEPNKVYYGILDGDPDWEEIASTGRGTITFVCPDPDKYGPEITATFPGDVVTVTNNGTSDADPVFELEVLQPVTFAMIQNQDDEYMMIGKPVSVEDTPTSNREVVTNEDCSSTVGWLALAGGTNIYNLGIAGGNMISNGWAFLPETYGTNPNGWVGPAIKQSVPELLQDFECEIDIQMNNSSGGVGRIMVLGLDENSNLVFSMGMMDSTATYPNNRALFGLGPNNKTWINYQGDNNRVVWNDARLMLRIRRKGQMFEGWIAEKLDPQGTRLTGRHWDKYEDRNNEYQQKIAQILIYMAGAKSYAHFPMYFHHLKVTKLINLSDYEVAYIAEEGDIITFDTTTEKMLINGENRKDIKDFGATFFKLRQGVNQLMVHPSESFNVSVRFRERFS